LLDSLLQEMSQAQLNMGRVQVGDMREVARLEFLTLLDHLNGTKALVWDQALTGPMGLIAEYSILKEHEVMKMFPLSSGPLPAISADNVVFITRPSLSCMDIIADNIKQEERRGGSGVKTEFHIFFVPRKSLLCEKRLVQAGVFGSLSCSSLPIYLFPLDTDLLSMELNTAYGDLVTGDLTSLHYVATALTRLQAVTGVIPRIYGKGTTAAQVFDLMVRMKREACGQEPQVRPQIDTLILLDRGVDLISPLPTQLTYEGLIDEMFGIQCASVRIEDKIVPLSSQEDLYQELRGLNFNAVGPTLSRKAKNISAQFEERHEARTVREIKQFVDKLPGMQTAKQSLATHTTVAELVKEKIDSEEFLSMLELEQSILSGAADSGKYLEEVEDLACSSAPLSRVLRLICLQSVLCSGLKPRLLDQYRRLILHSYGHSWLGTLDKLTAAGLFGPSTGARPSYAMLRKRLGLVIDNVDELNPTDIAYVHSVYGPLSVKLVMHVESPGWRNMRDVLDQLPGPSFEDTQQSGQSGRHISREKKVVLVFFVGGVTMAEVAALRFLSQQDDSIVEYLVATTSVITGNTFIESLSSKLEAPVF